jgi:alpha-beta hydrolase superfamily lysophospholipase
MTTKAKVRDRRYWVRLSLFAFVAFVSLVGLGLLGLSWLLTYTALHPPTKTTGETPADSPALASAAGDGLAYREISFVTADGVTLRGWHVPGQKGATVIFCHGFARDRSELLPEARWLAAAGYGALLFDLRAQGASDGAHISLGYLEALDVRAAVDYVLSQSPQDQIGVLGYSMGAVAAIRAAAADARIQAVIAVSPFATLREMVNQQLESVRTLAPLVVWWAERMTGLHLDDLRPVDDVAALSPRPILIMQAEADGVVPTNSGRRLYDAAAEPKTLWSVPDVDHVSFRQAVPELYKEQIIGFFQQHLPLD